MTTTTFRLRLLTSSALVLASLGAPALANPEGGVVAAGAAVISGSGGQTTIVQSSDRAIIDWKGFNLASGESASFIQPTARSVLLNRTSQTDASRIDGSITANGRIFIVNPNGVIFGQGAQIQVGGLVVSTADIANGDFMTGAYRFDRPSPNDDAIIVNGGTISIADTGLAAFVAPNVANRGAIVARAGSVTLAGRSTFTLDLTGDGLLSFDTGQAAPAGLKDGAAVALGASEAAALVGGVVGMGQTASATHVSTSGGHVVLSGSIDVSAQGESLDGGKVGLVGSSITTESTSRISADGIRNGGSAILIADDTARYAGGITARGGSGDGGFVETSAAHVDFTGVTVDTSSAMGKSGLWLIDPTDLNVDAAAAATIGANLATTDVTLKTFASGNPAGPGVASNGPGDINLNSAISWTGAHKLTLSAFRNVAVNANIGSASNNASVALIADNTGTGTGTVVFAPAARIAMTGQETTQGRAASVDLYYNPANFDTPTNFSGFVTAGNLHAHMLIRTIDQLQSINATSARLRQDFALSRDIDASATAGWNGGLGFVPIGTDGALRPPGTFVRATSVLNGGNGYQGNFDGLGHDVTGLTINRRGADFVGLFGWASGEIRNVGLRSGSVDGTYYVGGLVGYCNCLTDQANNFSLRVTGISEVGGLIGKANNASINNSGSYVDISALDYVGGLVGSISLSTISRSFATGVITGNYNIGGLIGSLFRTDVTNSHATGNIRPGAGSVTFGTVFNPDTGEFEEVELLSAFDLGGLVGSMNGGTISNSFATGSIGLFGSPSAVNDTGRFGGLVGDAQDVTINDSYATGSITFWTSGGVGGGLVGSFYGDNTSRGINRSYATGNVSGGNGLGGLVGTAFGLNANPNDSIVDSYATGNVTGTSNVGGLVGTSGVPIVNSHATGRVTGEKIVGGLVGENKGIITISYATGDVVQRTPVGGFIVGWAGGLVGLNTAQGVVDFIGKIDQSYASGAVSGEQYVGGLAGRNDGGVISNAYATGAVTGTVQQIGGLVGANNKALGASTVTGRISDSYAAGRVSGAGATDVGGLIGKNTSDPIVSSYWDTQTSGQAASSGGAGLTTAQMQDLGSFQTQYAGWNFQTIWSPPNRSGQGGDTTAHYPELYKISKVVWGDAAGVTLATRVYGDANPTLTGGVTYYGLRSGDSVITQPVFAAPAATAVGTYSGQLGGAAASNVGGGAPYRFIYTGGQLTITPAPIGVTALGGSSMFGQSPANPGLSATGLKNGETVSVLTGLSNSFGITGSTGVGAYTLDVIGTLTNPNYTVNTRTSGSWTVNPALLTVVTAGLTGAVSKVYDGTTLATLTPGNFLLSGFVGSDGATVNQTMGAYASANAGSGIVVTAALAPSNFVATGGTDLSNYALPTTASGAIGTITKAPLTLTYTADPASRDYGALNPAFTGAVGASGLVNGELLANVITGTAIFDSAANSASPVGSYAINGSGLSGNSGNYSFSFVQAASNATALTITPALLNLAIAANSLSRSYGDANPLLTYNLTGGALQGGDAFSGALATAATPLSPVGIYDITQGTLTAGPNYVIAFTPGTLSIIPARITVTALGGQSTFGESPANPGIAASGLKNGETVSVLTGLTNSFGITSATGVGAYALNVVGALGNGNYIIDARYPGSWTVIPAILNLDIQANSLSRIYGDANPLLTYTLTSGSLVNGDQLTGALATSAAVTSPVGIYDITQGTLSAGANYIVDFTKGALTINPAHLSVTALGGQSFAGQSPANPGLSATGLRNGEGVAVLTGLSNSFGINSSSPAGGYGLDVVGTLSNGNYIVDTRTSGNWTVAALAVPPSGLHGRDRAADESAIQVTSDILLCGIFPENPCLPIAE